MKFATIKTVKIINVKVNFLIIYQNVYNKTVNVFFIMKMKKEYKINIKQNKNKKKKLNNKPIILFNINKTVEDNF